MEEKTLEEENMIIEKLLKIQEKQDNCDHLATYTPVGQKDFEDKAKGVIVIITTIMCNTCGHLFFDTQETNIKLRVTMIPAVSEVKGGKNGQSN